MIRAAFPFDRRRNASRRPATAVSPARPAATSDQSCAPSRALVAPAEIVRGSWCRRISDSFSCRSDDPWSATIARTPAAEPASRCRPSSGVTDSGPSDLASPRSTVLSDDFLDGAVGSIAPRCTCGASTEIAATGASAAAGASAGLACSVAAGAGRATGAAAAVASGTGETLSGCTDSATAGEATSATGADPVAGAATREGSKVKGST
jgi:hypothetical protein